MAAGKPLGWEQIFDLRRSGEIREAIKLLQSFGDVYDKIIKESKELKDSYSKNMASVVQSTKKFNEEVKRLSPITEQGQQGIVNLSSKAEVLSASYKELNGKISNVNSAMNRLTKEKVEVSAKTSQLIKLQNEEARLQNKLASLSSKEAESISRLRVQIQERNAAMKRTAQEALGLVSIYQKETQKLIELRKRYKDVALQYGENSKKARELRKEVTLLDARLKRLDAGAGQHQRSVGNYGRAWGGLASTFRQVGSAMGFVGVIFGLINILRNAARAVVEFDREMVNLAAISGKSRSELLGVETEIRRVAATSINTANDVAKTATALKTLGKSDVEIVGLLEPVNNLSIALQATSAEAGELLVQTMNAFGASGEEADRYADIIAKMRTSTALDFTRIKDSLGFLAPVSKAVGLTLEETGAILGTLVDNGIKAARAGRLMSSSFSRLNKMGMSLDEALEAVNNSTDKTRTATQLFGTEAFALGLILAENTERVADYTAEFEKAGGTLQDLADKQMESLSAKSKILNSAWQELILSIENGQGVIGKFIGGAIEAVTGFINIIAAAQNGTISWAEAMVALQNPANAAFVMAKVEAAKMAEQMRINAELAYVNKEAQETYNAALESGVDTFAKYEKVFSQSLEGDKHKTEILAAVRELYNKELEKSGEIVKENAKAQEDSGIISMIEAEIKALQERKKLAESEDEIESINHRIRAYENEKRRLDELGNTFLEVKSKGVEPMNAELDDVQMNLQKVSAETGRTANVMQIVFDKLGAFFEDFGQEIEQAFFGFLGALEGFLQAQEEARIARYETQLEQLEEQQNKELEAAGRNEAARLAIEQRYQEQREKIEDKIRKERTKAARRAKVANVAQSIINTALAVTRALSEGGPILAAIVGTLGAAQTALIAGTPIPEYFKGTPPTGHDGGLASVAERGREIIQTPTKTFLQDRPAIMDLPKGTKVFTNTETERIIKENPKEQIKNIDNASSRIKDSNNQVRKQEMQMLANGMRNNGIELASALDEIMRGVELHTWKTGKRGLRKDVRRGNTTLLDVRQENRHG